MEAALTSKGQATIPKAVRDHLHLEPGDRVKFFLHPDGSVVILPKLPTSALKGMVSPREKKRASIEEMNEAVEADAADIHRPDRMPPDRMPPDRMRPDRMPPDRMTKTA